jgi:hypothetical protein
LYLELFSKFDVSRDATTERQFNQPYSCTSKASSVFVLATGRQREFGEDGFENLTLVVPSNLSRGSIEVDGRVAGHLVTRPRNGGKE